MGLRTSKTEISALSSLKIQFRTSIALSESTAKASVYKKLTKVNKGSGKHILPKE
jgi:hypothetical protein